MTKDTRPSCVDCGATNFLTVIRVFCSLCDPVLRCQRCHDKHIVHIGVVKNRHGIYVRAKGGTT